MSGADTFLDILPFILSIFGHFLNDQNIETMQNSLYFLYSDSLWKNGLFCITVQVVNGKSSYGTVIFFSLKVCSADVTLFAHPF